MCVEHDSTKYADLGVHDLRRSVKLWDMMKGQIVVSISSEYQIFTHVQICCCQKEPREGRTDVEQAMYAEKYRARLPQYRELALITYPDRRNKGPCRGKALLTVSLSRVNYRYRFTRHFTGHCDTSFPAHIKFFSSWSPWRRTTREQKTQLVHVDISIHGLKSKKSLTGLIT